MQSSEPLPTGQEHRARRNARLKNPATESPPTVKLFIDRKEIGAGRVERTVPLGYSAEGLDIGMDNISAVSPDYKAPFAFGGTIRSVTIAIQK